MADAGKRRLIVRERFDDRGDVVRLKLASETDENLPAFAAGAHLKLHMRAGDAELVRDYSLCSDPARTDQYEIGVLKEPDGRGSVAIHHLGQPGVVFTAEGPDNNFMLHEDAPLSVLVAGGIGVTPMIAMARRLHALNRDFVMHYCTRAKDVTAFHDDLSASPYTDRVNFHFDNGAKDQLFDPKRMIPDPSMGAHLYVCGPQGFMEWVLTSAADKGYPTGQIHFEYFSADVDTTGDSFEVEARTSGVTVVVGSGETIVNALAAAGVFITVNCEEGVCGTCLTDVLEGEIDHRDHFLTDEEHEAGDILCACCARAKGAKLVLDI